VQFTPFHKKSHYFVAIKKKAVYYHKSFKISLSIFFSRYISAVFLTSLNVVKVFADHLPKAIVDVFYRHAFLGITKTLNG